MIKGIRIDNDFLIKNMSPINQTDVPIANPIIKDKSSDVLLSAELERETFVSPVAITKQINKDKSIRCFITVLIWKKIKVRPSFIFS